MERGGNRRGKRWEKYDEKCGTYGEKCGNVVKNLGKMGMTSTSIDKSC